MALLAAAGAQEPVIRVSDLERRIHDLINSERAIATAPPLKLEEPLSAIARAHSTDMARRNFFDHVNPEGLDPAERGRRAGYPCRKVYSEYFTEGLAENIYQGSLYRRIIISGAEKSYEWYSTEELARDAVKGWLNSSGHKRNLLDKRYERTGMGASIAPDRKVYITQVFC